MSVSKRPLCANLSMAVGVTAHVGDVIHILLQMLSCYSTDWHLVPVKCKAAWRCACKSSEEADHKLANMDVNIAQCIVYKQSALQMFIEKGNWIQHVCILVFNLFTRKLHRVPLNNKDNVVNRYWSPYLLVGSVYSPDYDVFCMHVDGNIMNKAIHSNFQRTLFSVFLTHWEGCLLPIEYRKVIIPSNRLYQL